MCDNSFPISQIKNIITLFQLELDIMLHQSFLIIESSNCKEQSIQVTIKLNQKEILKQKIKRSEIPNNNQKKCLIDLPSINYSFEFIEIFAFSDSSIHVRGTRPLREHLMIKSQADISLQNIRCKKITLKSASLSIYHKNEIYNDLQYVYAPLKCGMQKLSNEIKGWMRLKEKSSLAMRKLKLVNSDLIIQSQGSCRLKQNNLIMSEKTDVVIYLQGKLFSQTQLKIASIAQLVNEGYLGSKSQPSLIVVQCAKLKNYGHIKADNLNVFAGDFINHQYGEISAKNGEIIVQKGFINEGQIFIPGIKAGFSQQKGVQLARNTKDIVCKIFISKSQLFENKGYIKSQELKVHGFSKLNCFKNQSVIETDKLQVINMILENSDKGIIINNKTVEIHIEGWINNGNSTIGSNSNICINGNVYNTGALTFNSNLFLSANSFYNKKQVNVKGEALINLNELFLNDKGGSVYIKKATIISEKIKNLGSIIIPDGAFIQTKTIQNQCELMISKAHIISDYLSNTGTAAFVETNLRAKNIKNQGTAVFKEGKIEANLIKNDNNFSSQGQKINVKQNIMDSKSAKTHLNNAEYQSYFDKTLNSDGITNLMNTKLEGVKNIYSTNTISLDSTNLNLSGFEFRELKLKDAHITFKTFKKDADGKIINMGGYNGLHQFQRKSKQDKTSNDFQVDFETLGFLNQVQIQCSENQAQNIHLNVVNPFINGWTILSHPIGLGSFNKRLTSKKFEIPGNVIQKTKKEKEWKKLRKAKNVDPELFNKMMEKEMAYTGEQQLTIQTPHLVFSGGIKYEGQNLNIHTSISDLQIARVTVPNGNVRIISDETMLLVHSYLSAKGITLSANRSITTEAIKYIATVGDLLMSSARIIDRPTVNKRSKTSYWGDECSTRTWQQGFNSKIYAAGNIVVEASEFIRMISPSIESKQDILFNSPQTTIQGIYLFDQTVTTVEKDTTFGGSKTNTYVSRNDKPLPAELKAKNIVFSGEANINANFTAQKIIDLTQSGIRMGFVIGYSGYMENRQFSNFFTQGVEGYMKTSEKFLKTNLKNVMEICRPEHLKGQMIFDTVEWGKVRPKIVGRYKEIITKAKSWYKSWEEESIGVGLIAVVSMVAAFAGFNYIGAFIAEAAGAAAGSFTAMAIQTSVSAIVQNFAVGLVTTGTLQGAFKKVFSMDTLISAALNIAITGVFDKLASKDFLNLDLKSAAFTDILKKKLLKFMVSTSFKAIAGQGGKDLITAGVKDLLADVLYQYGAKNIAVGFSHKSGIEYLIHKGVHGVLGGLSGLIISGNKMGALSGAVGAMAAEVAIEMLVPVNAIEQIGKQKLKKGEGFQMVNESFETEKMIAKMIGVVAGGLFGNIDTAVFSANAAIDYNFSSALAKIAEQMGRFLIYNDPDKNEALFEDEYFKKDPQLHQIYQLMKAEAIRLKVGISDVMQFFGLSGRDLVELGVHIKQKKILNYLAKFGKEQLVGKIKNFIKLAYDPMKNLFMQVSYYEEMRKWKMIEDYAEHNKMSTEKAYQLLDREGLLKDYQQFQIIVPEQFGKKNESVEMYKKLISVKDNLKKGHIGAAVEAFKKKEAIPKMSQYYAKQGNDSGKKAVLGGIQNAIEHYIPQGKKLLRFLDNGQFLAQNYNKFD